VIGAVGRVRDSLTLARSALADARARLDQLQHGEQRQEIESHLTEIETSLAELIRSLEAAT